MSKIIGIDLGTTNSCVSVLEGGEPTVITNPEGGRTTPSVVAFAKDGDRLVGQTAKRQAVTNPENTIFSIKRFMGRMFKEVDNEISEVPYKVEKNSNGAVIVRANDKDYTPPEISAMVLQKLKQDAEEYLGNKAKISSLTIDSLKEQTNVGLNNCTKEEFEEALKTMPKNVNWSQLSKYEEQDFTAGAQELACAADGGCEVVDL